MDIELLRTFQRVAYLKSIYKAADELYVSQSTVMSRIRVFEEGLGCELLARIGRGVQLTSKGELLLSYVERTLEVLNEGIREIKSRRLFTDSFQLASVTAVASYYLPSILAEFRKQYPQVIVHVETASTSDILERVMNGKVEIGMVRGPFEHKGVELETIFSDPIIPIISRSHPWAVKESVAADDFLGQTILASDRKSSIWTSIMEWFKINGINPHIGMEVDHVETTKQMVYHNPVIAFVPFMTVQNEISEGRLKKVSLNPPMMLDRDTILIRHRRKPLSTHAHNFWHQLIKNKRK